MAAIYRAQRAGGVAVFAAMSGDGASDLLAAVDAEGTVTYTGTAAVVASIVSASEITAAVAAAGSITYTGAAAVLASVGSETYSDPRFTVRMVPRVSRIGGGAISEIDRA